MNRSETIQFYCDTKEYRISPYGLNRHLRRCKLSSGAKECFRLLFDEATFSNDWSTKISRKQIAYELGTAEKPKNINAVSKLLAELEKSKYIIRDRNIGGASTIYINFPEDVINDIEATPDRKKVEAIRKCGTIPTQKRVGGLRKNASFTICNNILNTNNTKQDTREVESCDSSKGNSVVDWFLDNDSDSSSVDTSMQENELAKDIASLEISIQSLYNQTKDKRSDEVLKIYAEVDKLSPQKHELERRLAILQHKPKKNNVSDSLQKFTVKQLEAIRDCCLYQSLGDKGEAKKYARGLMQQVLEGGSLDAISYKTGKLMTIQHRLNIAKHKIYSKNEEFDFGIN